MERAIQVLQRLKGPVVPLNICFTGDNEIDYPAPRFDAKYAGTRNSHT